MLEIMLVKTNPPSVKAGYGPEAGGIKLNFIQQHSYDIYN